MAANLSNSTVIIFQDRHRKDAMTLRCRWTKAIRFAKSLSKTARLIGGIVSEHTDAATGRTGRYGLSMTTMAAEGGCSRTTVWRALNELRRDGWLAWKSGQNANHYALVFVNVSRTIDEAKERVAEARAKAAEQHLRPIDQIDRELTASIGAELERYRQTRAQNGQPVTVEVAKLPKRSDDSDSSRRLNLSSINNPDEVAELQKFVDTMGEAMSATQKSCTVGSHLIEGDTKVSLFQI
jgi:DNA-binding transcriptional regulator YhcF (GntR family)